MDVDGCTIEFRTFREAPIAEGDEVIVAGAGDFIGLNVIYSNLTRSLRSPDWNLPSSSGALASAS